MNSTEKQGLLDQIVKMNHRVLDVTGERDAALRKLTLAEAECEDAKDETARQAAMALTDFERSVEKRVEIHRRLRVATSVLREIAEPSCPLTTAGDGVCGMLKSMGRNCMACTAREGLKAIEEVH